MMRIVSAVFSFALISSAAAQSLNDKAVLATDPGFIQRVRTATIATAIAISNEGTAVPFHISRDALATQIMLNPDLLKAQFSEAVATDATVSSNATQAGTVPLVQNVTTCTGTPAVCTTTGNASTQAALVTDAAINNAVSAQWNSFFNH